MMALRVALVEYEPVLVAQSSQLQNMGSTPELLQLALGVAGVPRIVVMTVCVRFRGNGSRTLGWLHFF